MLNYKNILIATCLTPQSDSIAARAQELAEANKATLHIAHVLEQTTAAYGGEFSINIDVEYEQTLEHNLQKMLDAQAEKHGIAAANRHLETGAIKHAIVDLANDLGCDLIVVGTHPHHGIEKLLGSKANAILHLAKCDVLTVRMSDK
ncbi:MAG: universal stress protein [Coxiellaceae bacterium]|nr:universal stress protein [Coxiellaceae bacterium]